MRFLSRSSSSFLVREDKDNVWQDEGVRERLWESFFASRSPSLRFCTLPRGSVPHVEYYRAEKRKGSAYCFSQQYEMKVVQTLARDLPWNFHVCLVLPIIFKPSNSSSPPEYNLHKNSLVPRRPVRLSCIRGVRFSHLFVRKRQHGSRGYAIVY